MTRRNCPGLLRAGMILLSYLSAARIGGAAGDTVLPYSALDPEGIGGTLILCGEGSVTPEVMRTLRRATPDGATALVILAPAEPAVEDVTRTGPWREAGFETVDVVPLPADSGSGVRSDLTRLGTAGAVWVEAADPDSLAEACASHELADALGTLLRRGGAIGGRGSSVALLTALRRSPPGEDAQSSRIGLELLPGAELCESDDSGVAPSRYGLRIPSDVAAIVRGRRVSVVGDGTVTVYLPTASSGMFGAPPRPELRMELTSDRPADLTALRRSVTARAGAEVSAGEPVVREGALVIVGGGSMPEEAARRFVALAGGPDALIVVLPTAEPGPAVRRATVPGFLTQAGAKNVRVLAARTRDEVESEDFRMLLREAGGVWFGGGRQWRFVDAYEGTTAVEAFHDVLRRGGVIGGSSAGASIQAEYLARGNPLGNAEIMSEGYERGFGFLPGTAIDQHFAQRDRFADMERLVATFPQLLGIGIDEGTAMIVEGRMAEIVGRGEVHFYDARGLKPGEPLRRESVGRGGHFDLVERRSP